MLEARQPKAGVGTWFYNKVLRETLVGCLGLMLEVGFATSTSDITVSSTVNSMVDNVDVIVCISPQGN